MATKANKPLLFLLKKANCLNVTLGPDTEHETVQVRLNSGDHREVLWIGLIERSEIPGKLISGKIRPVKIKAHSYRSSKTGEWVPLQPGEYVQGCLVTGEGVSAVIEYGHPRIVTN